MCIYFFQNTVIHGEKEEKEGQRGVDVGEERRRRARERREGERERERERERELELALVPVYGHPA